MDHLAIMNKNWKLTDKILSRQKKIESRWYASRRLPWDRIKKNDTVYFKDSGAPVKLKAAVGKVIQLANLTPSRVRMILNEYGADDGIAANELAVFWRKWKDKKYCILVFLRNPVQLVPFNIDKTGFGAMSSWISVTDINQIRKKSE